MNDERVDSRPKTLDESLLSHEVISGQTSINRLDIYQRAAKASGFSLTVIPEGEEFKRAVDPTYDDEVTPVHLIKPRQPFIKNIKVNARNIGYYVGRPEGATSHAAFWDAVSEAEKLTPENAFDKTLEIFAESLQAVFDRTQDAVLSGDRQQMRDAFTKGAKERARKRARKHRV